MASNIFLPASYGGYVTSQALQSLGLTQTTTPGGGTGYKDASGNIYTFNGSQFVPLPASAGGSVPAPASAPAATPPPTSTNSQIQGTPGNLYTVQNGQQVPYTPSFPAASSGASYTDPNTGYTYEYGNGTWQPFQTGTNGSGGGGAGAAAPNPNASVIGIGNLGPGSTGANVQALQTWLVQNGYMTQAQMNTGPGTYGPQTTAAVAAWQKANNINTNGNPGYFGPISQQFLQQQATTLGAQSETGTSAGSTGTSGNIPGTNIPSTGNSNLDSILSSLSGLISSGQAVIPPGLQITPALTQQFLAWAHQVVDPQTQQLIQSEITNINAASQNAAVQYQATQGEDIQQFGAQLAGQDNSAGASGIAFSGLHNVQDQNLVNSTNRTLQSLDANTAYNIGQGLRTTAADVGSANAGGINTPTLTGATVGLTGGNLSGGQGSSSGGNTLDFSYNPSLYTAGNIPSSQSTAVSNLAGNYLSQYGTLAGANSGQSISQLIGGITGLPAGYTVPSNLT